MEDALGETGMKWIEKQRSRGRDAAPEKNDRRIKCVQETGHGDAKVLASPAEGRHPEGVALPACIGDGLRAKALIRPEDGWRAVRKLLRHIADNGRPGRERLDVTAESAIARRAIGVDDHMSEFSRQPVVAPHHAVVHDHACAYASAHRDV